MGPRPRMICAVWGHLQLSTLLLTIEMILLVVYAPDSYTTLTNYLSPAWIAAHLEIKRDCAKPNMIYIPRPRNFGGHLGSHV